MKLMFASDIHGSALYAEKLLARLKDEAPQRLVLLGDILYHGPRPKRGGCDAECAAPAASVCARQL